MDSMETKKKLTTILIHVTDHCVHNDACAIYLDDPDSF